MTMLRKYEFTNEPREVEGHTLHRIMAVRDFGDVRKGALGGFVEKENNLSHTGNAWVADEACAFEGARVYGNAEVCGDARVYGNAEVFGNARVFGDAEVYGDAMVFGNARVYGNAKVCGDARVYGNAKVFGNAEVFGDAEVYGDAMVCGDARVYGNAKVCGDAIVYDDAHVYGNAKVFGNAEVYDNSRVCGDAEVFGNADYIVFKNWWSSGRYFTWTRSNNMWKVGCFHGSGAELIAKAYKDSEQSGREYERVVKYVESILADEGNKDN